MPKRHGVGGHFVHWRRSAAQMSAAVGLDLEGQTAFRRRVAVENAGPFARQSSPQKPLRYSSKKNLLLTLRVAWKTETAV